MAYHEPTLQRVIDRAGGASKLARALNIFPSAVSQWSRVPAERVPAVSEITGLSRHEIRPDLWEPEASEVA